MEGKTGGRDVAGIPSEDESLSTTGKWLVQPRDGGHGARDERRGDGDAGGLEVLRHRLVLLHISRRPQVAKVHRRPARYVGGVLCLAPGHSTLDIVHVLHVVRRHILSS